MSRNPGVSKRAPRGSRPRLAHEIMVWSLLCRQVLSTKLTIQAWGVENISLMLTSLGYFTLK